ncbi:MAG: hypothetical protein HY710_03000 [Candidatus Latescibacteria bacterium]|nr:hypothetical protein [Candidatus Latescibacterota bacterium]
MSHAKLQFIRSCGLLRWLCAALSAAVLWPSSTGSGADGLPDPQTIIARIRVHADDYVAQSARYSFHATVLREDLDQAGTVKARYEEKEHIFHVHGQRYARKLSVNGQPLRGTALAEEERRERAFRERTKTERTRADSSDLSGDVDRRWVYLSDLIPRYEYRTVRTELLNGRMAYMLSYRPRPGLKARERRDLVYNRLVGTVWVDTQEYRIVKADGRLTDDLRIGLIALHLTDMQIRYEQQRVEPNIWLPRRIEVRFVGSIFFVKKLNRRASIELSDFVRMEGG